MSPISCGDKSDDFIFACGFQFPFPSKPSRALSGQFCGQSGDSGVPDFMLCVLGSYLLALDCQHHLS